MESISQFMNNNPIPFTILAVILLMILFIFVILMVAILISQFWDFIVSVYREAVYR